MNSKVALVAFVSLITLAVNSSVKADPGVIEINQACVAVGCFPGDSAGFPVTISSKGAYALSSDIVVPVATTTAILVNSNDVSIDLKGFGVRGPNVCTGQENACADTSLSGTGIEAPGRRNITVRDGTAGGFGFAGISLGEQANVHNVRAEHNTRVGIWVRKGSTLTSSSSNFNGYLGFETDQARLTDCSAADNGQIGMAIGAGSLVERAIVVRTANQVGILDWYGSRILNSSVSANPDGIESINGGTSVVDSVIFENSGFAVKARGDGAIYPPAGLPVSLRANSFLKNNGGLNAVQYGGSGVFINLGSNVCGTDTTCP